MIDLPPSNLDALLAAWLRQPSAYIQRAPAEKESLADRQSWEIRMGSTNVVVVYSSLWSGEIPLFPDGAVSNDLAQGIKIAAETRH